MKRATHQASLAVEPAIPSVARETGELTVLPEEKPDPGVRQAIGIFKLTAGFTTWAWLCAKHKATREANGWTVEPVERRANFRLDCDDCRLSLKNSGAGDDSPAGE